MKKAQPLEEFHKLKEKLIQNDDFHLSDLCSYVIVKKALLVIEILRESPEFAWYVKVYKDAYSMLLENKGFRVDKSMKEINEEFNLIKEVLS